MSFVGLGFEMCKNCFGRYTDVHISRKPPGNGNLKQTLSYFDSSVWRMQKSGVQLWSAAWLSRVKCPHTEFRLGDYSLQIQSVRAEDAGIYTCIFFFKVLSKCILSLFAVSFSPAAPIMNQRVEVSCGVTGGEWPSGSRVQWTLNGRPYETPKTFGRQYRQPRNTPLSFKAVESVRGNWTCVVTHKKREWRTSALLDVKGIVQPPNDSTKIYAAVGSAADLPCVFSKNLTTSNALWERIHNISTSKPAALPASFSAPWSSVMRTRDGTGYFCGACFNEHSVSFPPVEVEVLSRNEASLTLTCQLSDTSDVTEYEWIYTASDLSGNRFIASVQKGRTVTLSQESEGQWTCRFSGEQGVLGNVTYNIQHMSSGNEEKPSVVSHNAAVLIGLSFLLLILLLTLNQLYRNHQRVRQITALK
uniref:Ig-like domain-containing protein n=1 Tax=Neogobius melanostomus TaxID=47308 RepID=A0A8C6UJE1_9GOBI